MRVEGSGLKGWGLGCSVLEAHSEDPTAPGPGHDAGVSKRVLFAGTENIFLRAAGQPPPTARPRDPWQK